ncbi:MAG TPA: arginine repressor [Candidatus Paceibacterota bacterium]|nr:arginine repressor [Candidatus Paceibacterota bacterium]
MVEPKRTSASARRAKVISFVQAGLVRSQSDLVRLLEKSGFEVTQATASRDLVDIGAIRSRDREGNSVYQLQVDEAQSRSRVISLPWELILSVESSGNLAVVRTPPGGAQLLACALDVALAHGLLNSFIGTIAGDDTVLLVSKKSAGGAALAKELRKIAEPMKISHRGTNIRGVR